MLTGTLFYWHFEDWTVIEALYFCIVTLATVGFGDFTPTTAGTQIFTIFYILTGFGVLVALLTSVAEKYIEQKAEGPGARESVGAPVDSAARRTDRRGFSGRILRAVPDRTPLLAPKMPRGRLAVHKRATSVNRRPGSCQLTPHRRKGVPIRNQSSSTPGPLRFKRGTDGRRCRLAERPAPCLCARQKRRTDLNSDGWASPAPTETTPDNGQHPDDASRL